MKEYIESLEALSRKQLLLILARQRLELIEGLAIVGMSCRFPGGIDDLATFWDALLSRRVVSGETMDLPRDSTGRPRWNLDAPDLAPIAELLRRGCYLENIDLFDAARFGISDEEATYMDPQQRLLLSCASEALADAGVTDTMDMRIGVFAGMSNVEYNYAGLRNGIGVDDLSEYMGTGSSLSAAAARVAVGLRCNGPAITIDTACSSALTALHIAASSLRRKECDLAVVGAVHLLLAPFTTAVFAKAGMLSKTGRSRPLNADADGHVRGEGCGVLVLKRQTDARAQGNRPYAIVRGTSSYQHGDRAAMTVVSSIGQQRAIEEALHAVEIDPLAVAYVEAQANGSRLGGVIELETLARSYQRMQPDAPKLYVGSCKANLGYLETASGAASLIKAALTLHHACIPPQAAFDAPDPEIQWERMTIEVPRTAIEWPSMPRRLAGVSSFGFTGTNAHIVMESAEAAPRTDSARAAYDPKRYWAPINDWS